jgi:hypothetical protein
MPGGGGGRGGGGGGEEEEEEKEEEEEDYWHLHCPSRTCWTLTPDARPEFFAWGADRKVIYV